MELRIYLRQLQMFDLYGSPIVYTGPNPQSLQAVPGTVPQSTWVDYTSYTSDLDKIQLTFSLERDINGVSQAGAFQPKKAASGSLRFEAAAYLFIKAWCIDDVAAPLNGIDVRIEDTSCGDYVGFSIKSSQIQWCEDGACEFEVTLKQSDPYYQCVQKTLISDNWQGWFQTVPAGGKMHPRFSYCNEIRPNATLIVEWYMIRIFADISFILMTIVIVAINPIIFAINGIIVIINAINAILGTGTVSTIPYFNYNGITDYFRNLYVESAGCGREHPAPLIRDYITNVCDKCGVAVDDVTAPIFFAQNITLQASTRTLENTHNPHYNACYLTPQIARGIRRFRTNNYFNGPTPNNTDFYEPENAPVETLDIMLDKLKEVYNAEWRVTGGKLYFWRKDWFLTGPPIYDFRPGSTDRLKILEGICFEWNEVKYPAYGKGLYDNDPSDTCGNEALSQMNGYTMFGDKDVNPNYSGVLDKTTRYFGGTKFRLDAASTDYIFDVFQVLANGQVLQPSTIPQLKSVASWMEQYADYALLLRDETCALPKILIWDGVSYLNAKCVRDVVPVNNYLVPTDPTPQINTKYNALSYTAGAPNYESWPTRHAVKNHVIGSAWTPGGVPVGVYEATDYTGALIYHAAARLVNYPMYFEPGYLNTLWDWFHWIDDPRANPRLNMNWHCKIDLCCADLNILKVLGDATDIRLGYRAMLPTNYYQDGIIMEITVSYDSSDRVGKYIELKGTV